MFEEYRKDAEECLFAAADMCGPKCPAPREPQIQTSGMANLFHALSSHSTPIHICSGLSLTLQLLRHPSGDAFRREVLHFSR